MSALIIPRQPAKPLFNCWKAVEARIRRSKGLLLLLDFDGTLVGFRRDPKEVKLDQSTRLLLAKIALQPEVIVAMISGRRRADVKQRVGLRGIYYYGIHGWESRPGMRLEANCRKLIEAARSALFAKIKNVTGVWIEDKNATFVMHTRGASNAALRRALAAARSVALEFAPRIRVLRGKKVMEFMPANLPGKGEAVAKLIETHKGWLAIYAGDDETDEPAFAILRRGLTICVGCRKKTQARFCVRNPKELKMFLSRLATLLEQINPDRTKHPAKRTARSKAAAS